MKIAEHTILLALLVMALVLSGCSSAHIKDSQELESGTIEFDQFIVLEQTVHFPTESGNTRVPPGTYSVEAVESGLRLILNNNENTQPIILNAEAMTHEESLEVASPVSIRMDADQHMLAVLFPNGKGMQSHGSYSGIQARGFKFTRGFLKGMKIPRITGVLTLPKFGILQANETVIIKGKNFGTLKEGNGTGKVLLHGHFKHNLPSAVLKVEEWSPTKIKVKVQSNVLQTGVKDQQVRLQVKTAKGISAPHLKMPFKAARYTRWLNYKDTVVKVTQCSKSADANVCNDHVNPTGGVCAVSRPPTWKDKDPSIYAMHNNCDLVVDWDEGTDRYEITLDNGWVFKKFWLKEEKSGSKEWVQMPRYATLNKSVVGTSSWKPTIKWKTSPSDWVAYRYWIQIEGPVGVPYN